MIFIDSDVLLDLAQRRDPFMSNSAILLTEVERGTVSAGVTPLVLANVFYIIEKHESKEIASQFLRNVLKLCSYLTTESQDFMDALDSAFLDKEDAINYYTAKRLGVEMIITRNLKDFKEADIPVMTPEQFLHNSVFSP